MLPSTLVMLVCGALEAGASTRVPLYVGGQAQLELPYRALARLEVGYLPGSYVDAINGIVVAAGGYDEDDAAIIKDAIASSMILRLGAGWRPVETLGLELAGGYMLATLGGGLSAREGIELATGRQLPDDAGAREIPLTSTLHGLYLGADWRFELTEHWVARAGVSYEQIIGSKTTIDVTARRPAGQRIVDAVEQELDTYLDDLFTSSVRAAAIGFSISYRL